MVGWVDVCLTQIDHVTTMDEESKRRWGESGDDRDTVEAEVDDKRPRRRTRSTTPVIGYLRPRDRDPDPGRHATRRPVDDDVPPLVTGSVVGRPKTGLAAVDRSGWRQERGVEAGLDQGMHDHPPNGQLGQPRSGRRRTIIDHGRGDAPVPNHVGRADAIDDLNVIAA